MLLCIFNRFLFKYVPTAYQYSSKYGKYSFIAGPGYFINKKLLTLFCTSITYFQELLKTLCGVIMLMN